MRIYTIHRLHTIIATLVLLGSPAAARTLQQGDQSLTDRWPIDPESAPRPVAQAVRASSEIHVDGVLDEPAWAEANQITDFIQSQPDAGYPSTERTVVRILYDSRRLYIGAECYDSQPDNLTVTSLERDLPGSTHDMDIFAITFDTFLDRRNAFIYLINPYGALRDGQVFNDSRNADYVWRGTAELSTTRHDSGWTVEMAIPWTNLRFDPTLDEQRWGMQILRRVRRRSEDSYWAPVQRRDLVHRMSKAGTLEGLKGITPGLDLRVKPFVLASDVSGSSQVSGTAQQGPAILRKLYADSSHEIRGDAGLDLKWGLTPNLTLDATYRTDFSHVEIDEERVNLTRFPLYFEEKRDFFVENSGSFVLGDVTEREYRMGSSLRSFTLFHSRRIGLTRDRRLLPMLGGGRLTGRVSDFEIGLLDVQTETFGSTPAENFAVARIRRNLGAWSDVGAMFVNRQAVGSLADGEFNRSFAADANLRLLGNMIVNSYVARTDEPDVTGNQTAARMSVAWRDRLWDASAFVQHIGDAFNPGVGFVQRAGIRHGYATFGAHPLVRMPLVYEVNPYAEVHYITDLDSRLLTRTATAGFGVLFRDGATASLTYDNTFEQLDNPFSVSGFEIPAGEYQTREGSASFSSNRSRPLSTRLSVGGGDYWGGTRVSLSGSATWLVDYHLAIDVSGSYNDVSLPDGSFDTKIYGTQIRYSYSTNLLATAYVQYNSSTDHLVTNLRLNWIHAPLSDFFLVYTERRDMGGKVVLDRFVTVKVTKLFAF